MNQNNRTLYFLINNTILAYVKKLLLLIGFFLSFTACNDGSNKSPKINYELSLIIFQPLGSDDYPELIEELCLPLKSEDFFYSCAEKPVNIFSALELKHPIKTIDFEINKQINLNVIGPHESYVKGYFQRKAEKIPGKELTAASSFSNNVKVNEIISQAKLKHDLVILFTRNNYSTDSSMKIVKSVAEYKDLIITELKEYQNKKIIILLNPPNEISNAYSNSKNEWSRIQIPPGFESTANELGTLFQRIANPKISWREKNNEIPMIIDRPDLKQTKVLRVNNSNQVIEPEFTLSDYLHSSANFNREIKVVGLDIENHLINKIYVHEVF